MSQKSKILINGQIKDFKKFFLLQFTNELIKHSETGEISKLKNILKKEADKEKEETKDKKEKVKQIIEKKEPFLILKQKLPIQKKVIKTLPKFTRTKPLILRVPEPKLPPHLQYLKPIPTTNREIDLEKLNPLIKDPAVKTIEVNPDKKVIVTGTMGTKPTNIILSKEEIDKIIKKFSEATKIPINEGIFRVVVGRLILSAIISEVVGSKFIIKKMTYSPIFRK